MKDKKKIDLDFLESISIFKDQNISSFFFNLLNSVNYPILVKDEKHRWVYLNNRMESFLSVGKECLGKKDDFYFSSDYCASCFEKDMEAFSTKKQVYSTEKITLLNGNTFVVLINRFVFPYNGKKYLLNIFQKINSFSELNDTSGLKVSFLLEVFKKLPEHYMVIRKKDLRFVHVNESAIKNLGYTLGDLIDQKIVDVGIVNFEDFSKVRLLTKTRKEYSNVRIPFYAKNGDKHIGLFSGRFVEIEGEEYLLQVVFDITKYIDEEERLTFEDKGCELLFNKMPFSIVSVGEDGKFLKVNEYSCKLFGAPSQDKFDKINILKDQHFIEANVDECFRRVLKTGHTESCEFTYVSKWGKTLYLRAVMDMVVENSNKFVLIVFEDVMERKVKEAELLESEKNYRLLFENMGSVVMILDENLFIKYVNSKGETFFGYSLDEMQKQKNCMFLVAKEYRDFIKSNSIKRKSGEDVKSVYEIKAFVDRGQSYRDVVLHVSMIPGTKNSIVSILDITERKNAELALKSEIEARKELEYIVNQGPLVIMQFSNEEGWPIEIVSKNISQFGYSNDELLDFKGNLMDLIHVDDVEHVRNKLITLTIEGLTEFLLQYRIKKKDSSYVWVKHRVWPKYSEDKVIISFQGIIIDVSDRKKAEKKNDELYKEMGVMKEKMKILSDLNKKGYTEGQKERLDTITRSARSMSQADLCVFYDFDLDKNQFNLLSVDFMHYNFEISQSLGKLKVDDFSWLKFVAKNKLRYQGNVVDDDLNISSTIKSFLFLPMVDDGVLKSALFLGFSAEAPVNTQELTFYDLFVIQASQLLKGEN